MIPFLLSLQYINERMQDIHCMSMAKVAVCGSAKHTHWPTEQLIGESAQSITNTQTFVHENLKQHFSAPEE